MNHKYEQRTICPNGEIRTRTIDANELVDLLLQMHFLKRFHISLVSAKR